MNPFTTELLRKNRLPVDDLRSKSWDEFSGPAAPRLDFVFTVCDNAAGEVCPLWPGQPVTAHWGVEDPAAVEGSDEEKTQGFFQAYNRLHNRIQLFQFAAGEAGPRCVDAAPEGHRRDLTLLLCTGGPMNAHTGATKCR